KEQTFLGRRHLYVANMNLAHAAWREGNVARMRDLLREQQREEQKDFLGFEWHYLWRLSHSELRTFETNGSSFSIAYSPDGRRIATAGYGTIRVWDLTTGQEALSLRGPTNCSFTSVAFSPDGGKIVAGGGSVPGEDL